MMSCQCVITGRPSVLTPMSSGQCVITGRPSVLTPMSSGQCVITGRPFVEDDRRFASVPSVALTSCCDDPSVRSAVVRRPALRCQTRIPTALSDCRDLARRLRVSHLTGSLLGAVGGARPPTGLDPRLTKTSFSDPPGVPPSGPKNVGFFQSAVQSPGGVGGLRPLP